MFVQDFKHLSPLPLNNYTATPEGPLAFPDFHTIRCTPPPFNLSSPRCTLYLTSINAITPFIFNIHQLFYMLLPDFLSIIHTFTTLLSSLRQLTPATSFFSPNLCLVILNTSRPSQHKSAFSTVSQAF